MNYKKKKPPQSQLERTSKSSKSLIYSLAWGPTTNLLEEGLSLEILQSQSSMSWRERESEPIGGCKLPNPSMWNMWASWRRNSLK